MTCTWIKNAYICEPVAYAPSIPHNSTIGIVSKKTSNSSEGQISCRKLVIFTGTCTSPTVTQVTIEYTLLNKEEECSIWVNRL
jgi:hypothetical protein